MFLFSGTKFFGDRILALMAMPIVGVFALGLLILNPFYNPGPLFFRQIRMGKHRKPFVMIKFRTMTEAPRAARRPEEGVEKARITPLGRILRKTRLDELPNFINVLRGEMSVIGPRPDAWNHGRHFSKILPDYPLRHAVRPGITGLAQVEAGYAEGADATRAKVEHDLRYIRNYGFRQDLRIVLLTLRVMVTGFGAR